MTTNEELTPATAPLVFVEWEDIQAHEDWNEESEADTTCSLKSVGWLIENSARKLVIAATYDYENGRWANKFAIPKLPPTVTPLIALERGDFHAKKVVIDPDDGRLHVPRPQENDVPYSKMPPACFQEQKMSHNASVISASLSHNTVPVDPQEDELDRHVPNPNKVDRIWVTDSAILDQP